MKKWILYTAILAGACTNTPPEDAAMHSTIAVKNDSTINLPVTIKKAPIIRLDTERAVFDSMEIPHAKISLFVNDSVVWSKQVTGDWTRLERPSYESYNIPNAVQVAYQSWWAGSGDIFYLIKQKDKWLVKHSTVGDEEESQENTVAQPLSELYPYTTVIEVPAQ